MNNEKEISFGAFDSELMHQEIFIPEGFTATIDGNKIILTRIENEDERVRKALITYFQRFPYGCIGEAGTNPKEAIAWLKKQGNQKSKKVSIWKHWKDGIAGNGEGKLIYLIKNGDDYSLSSSLGFECDYILLSDLDNLMLEKQGTSYTKKDVDDAYVEGMAFAKDELEKQGEQKPNANCLLRWSKEDEKMFQSLEDIVGDYWAKAEQEKNEIKIREASDVSYFLKTIQKSPLCWIKCSDGLPNKDGTYLVVTDGTHNDVYDLARYDSIDGWHKASEIIYWMPIPQLNNKSIIEQKSAEWSEEDEIGLSDALWAIKQARTVVKDENDMGTLWYAEHWLKSLRPQNTWKPSDAQIRALEYIINNAHNTSYSCKIAKELLEQLKKLKGE